MMGLKLVGVLIVGGVKEEEQDKRLLLLVRFAFHLLGVVVLGAVCGWGWGEGGKIFSGKLIKVTLWLSHIVICMYCQQLLNWKVWFLFLFLFLLLFCGCGCFLFPVWLPRKGKDMKESLKYCFVFALLLWLTTKVSFSFFFFFWVLLR